MWADALLSAERAHLARLLTWAAASVVAGVIVLLWVRRRDGVSILRGFGWQMTLWGAGELVVADMRWRTLQLRDYGGAVALAGGLRVSALANASVLLTGALLIVIGTARGRGRWVVGLGAGIGLIAHGIAIILLDVWFLSRMGATL